MFIYIFCSIVGGFGGPRPEANAVWGALAWKSLGTPGLVDHIRLLGWNYLLYNKEYNINQSVKSSRKRPPWGTQHNTAAVGDQSTFLTASPSCLYFFNQSQSSWAVVSPGCSNDARWLKGEEYKVYPRPEPAIG